MYKVGCCRSIVQLYSYLSLASSVASSSAVWNAFNEKESKRHRVKSRLCSAFSHLNVDVHALLSRHLFKTESLSNNVFQLELGLQAVGTSNCQEIQVLRHLDHFGGDQDVSVCHTALILRLAHGGHNCLSDEEKFFLRTPFSNLARRC